jgi:hypothetical protein
MAWLMGDPEEYARRAAGAEKRAAEQLDPDQKQQWEEIARQWRSLERRVRRLNGER